MRWRAMRPADLASVETIAGLVHPAYPEEGPVFAERLALHAAGCLMLEGDGGAAGYVLSHPWHFGRPPPLNSRLGHIPADADTYYLHDLALMPAARGSGAGAAAVGHLAMHAAALGLPSLSLVAVNASGGFWQRLGFAPADAVVPALASYDDDARLMVRPIAGPSP